MELKIIGVLLLALLAAGVLIRILNLLSALEPRALSQALPDTESTSLGQGVVPVVAAHPGLTGLHMLDDGRSAFAACVLLARAATRGLDID